MISINLIDAKRKEILKREQDVAKLSRILMIGILVAVLFLGVSVMIYGWFGNKLMTINTEIALVESEIGGYEKLAKDSQKVTKKLIAISEILPKRRLLKQKMELVTKLFNKDIDIKTVTLESDESEAGVDLEGVVISVDDLISLNDGMIRFAEEESLESLGLAALNRYEAGNYQARYSLILNEKVMGDGGI